jgi:hypothetical protein
MSNPGGAPVAYEIPGAPGSTPACPTCDRGEVPSREEIERIAMEFSLANEGGDASLAKGERDARLDACTRCDELAFGVLCRQCGCFIQIRSLNPRNRCPHPSGNRWNA